MTSPNATKTPKADGCAPLLGEISPAVQLLVELGDLLNRHLAAHGKAQERIASEIDQTTDRLVVAFHHETTPSEVLQICGTPANLFAIRLLALLLRESLVNEQGIYFNALFMTAQTGRSDYLLPTLAALAEMRFVGHIEVENGW